MITKQNGARPPIRGRTGGDREDAIGGQDRPGAKPTCPAEDAAVGRIDELAPMEASDEDWGIRVLEFRTTWLEALAEQARRDLKLLRETSGTARSNCGMGL